MSSRFSLASIKPAALIGTIVVLASYAPSHAGPMSPAILTTPKILQLSTNHRTAVKISLTDVSGLTREERDFVDRVNEERVERGLNAMSIDPMLVYTARRHSEEMCDRDYFDHHSPTAGIATPMDRYLSTLHLAGQNTPDYLLVGENIYYCSVLNDVYNTKFGHEALMNSPGHRANILEPRYTRIGVGTYRDAKGQFWVTEMFLRDVDPKQDGENVGLTQSAHR